MWFFFSILLGEFILKFFKFLVVCLWFVINGELVFVYGFSFFSGYVLVLVFFYGFLVLLLCYFNVNNCIKIIGVIILFFWIVLMLYDRVYLGVYYFSDVLGGFLLGIVWLCCFLVFYLGFLKCFYN